MGNYRQRDDGTWEKLPRFVNKRTGEPVSGVKVISTVMVGVGLIIFLAGIVLVCIAALIG